MKILVSTELLNERALDISIELKKIFDRAKQDQKGKLFASFAAIAVHLVNPNVSMAQALSAVGQDELPTELALFFRDNEMVEDAKTALKVLEIMDNTNPDSWGSFMEFSREQYG